MIIISNSLVFSYTEEIALIVTAFSTGSGPGPCVAGNL